MAVFIIMESEFIGTVERKTRSHTVYEVPRSGNKVFQDQIVDSLRYLADSISFIEESRRQNESPDSSELLSQFGWIGKQKEWNAPWGK